MEDRLERRELVRRGLLSGGAALAAASVPGLLKVRAALAQDEAAVNDQGIIEGAVGLEQTMVVVYRSAGRRKLLGALNPVAEQLARQEQAHVDYFSKALTGLGGKVPAPPLPDDIAGFTQIQAPDEMLRFALNLENQAVAAYLDAAKTLRTTTLLQTLTEIMASHGQHLVVIRQALNTNPVPDALPSGTEQK